MIVCELLLLLELVLLGVYVIYTDLKAGIVKNKAIGCAISIGVLINIVYYTFFARPFLGLFIRNLLVIVILAVFLFLKHYWGGGDSKLLICLILLIPGRLYDADESIPGLICLIIMFLLAYIYVIFESIHGLMRGEHFEKPQKVKPETFLQIVRDYLVFYMVLRLFNSLMLLLFPTYYQSNTMIIMLVNMMIILSLSDLKILKKKGMICALLVLFIGSLVVSKDSGFQNVTQIIRNILIIGVAFLIRYFVSGYNYQEIKTSEVKKGMILSSATVLSFSKSRVKDLPNTFTEDMRDRITEAQAQAVQRWGKSKSGSDTIVIVKKIPFAIFLVVGTFIYVLIRVVL